MLKGLHKIYIYDRIDQSGKAKRNDNLILRNNGIELGCKNLLPTFKQ